jgi:Druantia protein DruA
MERPIVFCGHRLLPAEIELIREVVADFNCLSLTEIARTICELLEWKRPNGRLKNHECRLLLEKLSDDGILSLPRLQESGPRGPRLVTYTPNGEMQEPLSGSVSQFVPLTLTVVRTGPESALWNELIERYHYLRYRVPVGANLRYLVRSTAVEQVLGCLLWSSPAWKMAARDRWIGWSDEQRLRNLQLVVNNSRFLILPWVRVRNLASTTLALCARQLPDDWEQLYGYRPRLLETVVDVKFRGTSYRAANWIYLGETRGRGRMDRQHAAHGRAIKGIFVYPLFRNVRQQLRETGGEGKDEHERAHDHGERHTLLQSGQYLD